MPAAVAAPPGAPPENTIPTEPTTRPRADTRASTLRPSTAQENTINQAAVLLGVVTGHAPPAERAKANAGIADTLVAQEGKISDFKKKLDELPKNEDSDKAVVDLCVKVLTDKSVPKNELVKCLASRCSTPDEVSKLAQELCKCDNLTLKMLSRDFLQAAVKHVADGNPKVAIDLGIHLAQFNESIAFQFLDTIAGGDSQKIAEIAMSLKNDNSIRAEHFLCSENNAKKAAEIIPHLLTQGKNSDSLATKLLIKACSNTALEAHKGLLKSLAKTNPSFVHGHLNQISQQLQGPQTEHKTLTYNVFKEALEEIVKDRSGANKLNAVAEFIGGVQDTALAFLIVKHTLNSSELSDVATLLLQKGSSNSKIAAELIKNSCGGDFSKVLTQFKAEYASRPEFALALLSSSFARLTADQKSEALTFIQEKTQDTKNYILAGTALESADHTTAVQLLAKRCNTETVVQFYENLSEKNQFLFKEILGSIDPKTRIQVLQQLFSKSPEFALQVAPDVLKGVSINEINKFVNGAIMSQSDDAIAKIVSDLHGINPEFALKILTFDPTRSPKIGVALLKHNPLLATEQMGSKLQAADIEKLPISLNAKIDLLIATGIKPETVFKNLSFSKETKTKAEDFLQKHETLRGMKMNRESVQKALTAAKNANDGSMERELKLKLDHIDKELSAHEKVVQHIGNTLMKYPGFIEMLKTDLDEIEFKANVAQSPLISKILQGCKSLSIEGPSVEKMQKVLQEKIDTIDKELSRVASDLPKLLNDLKKIDSELNRALSENKPFDAILTKRMDKLKELVTLMDSKTPNLLKKNGIITSLGKEGVSAEKLQGTSTEGMTAEQVLKQTEVIFDLKTKASTSEELDFNKNLLIHYQISLIRNIDIAETTAKKVQEFKKNPSNDPEKIKEHTSNINSLMSTIKELENGIRNMTREINSMQDPSGTKPDLSRRDVEMRKFDKMKPFVSNQITASKAALAR